MTKRLIYLLFVAILAGLAVAGWGADNEDFDRLQYVGSVKQDDSNTVGWDTDWVDSDWSDDPLTPEANHCYQYYEWLGPTVDQEGGVNVPNDDVTGPHADNDGLVSLQIDPVNHAVRVTFTISTQFLAIPKAWPAGSFDYVEAWVDWNMNGAFELGERVGLGWKGSPRIWDNGQNSTTGHIDGIAPGGLGTYNVRLRVDWGFARLPANPGGGAKWGEVEDWRYVEAKPATLPDPSYSQIAVPSHSTWALITLVVLLLGATVFVVRRKRAGGMA